MEFELSNLRPTVILDECITNQKELIKRTEISVSKTNTSGIIKYVNDIFTDTSGYSKPELIGEHHSIVRHPDMPKIIFKYLWESLNDEENFHGVLKNLAKDGRYYWVVTDYTIDKDENGELKGFTSRRRIAPESVVKVIKPFYEILLGLERTKEEKFVEHYFKSYIEEHVEHVFENVRAAYNNYIIDLFEKGLKKDYKVNRRKKINKTLDWFFNSDYDENTEVSNRMSFF